MIIRNKKNGITYFLLLAAAVVWGLILYNITHFLLQMDRMDDAGISFDAGYTLPPASAGTDRLPFSFTEVKRDPFRFEKAIKEDATSSVQSDLNIQPAVTKQVPVRPKLLYRIGGILINDKKRLILFEDRTDNTTVFLHEGDSYKGIKIKTIFLEKVILTEDGEKKEIQVNR